MIKNLPSMFIKDTFNQIFVLKKVLSEHWGYYHTINYGSDKIIVADSYTLEPN